MLYEMLEGNSPFNRFDECETEEEYLDNVKNLEVEFSDDNSSDLKDLQDLILKLLHKK